METARQFLDNKEEIPDNVMCQLIKGKLVHVKQVEKDKELARIVRYFKSKH